MSVQAAVSFPSPRAIEEVRRCELPPITSDENANVDAAVGHRRLRGPRMSKIRISLPEFLQRSAETMAERGKPKETKLPQLTGVIPAAPTSANRRSKGVGLPEFERRRRVHPRLRWPRLAGDRPDVGPNGILSDSSPRQSAEQHKDFSPTAQVSMGNEADYFAEPRLPQSTAISADDASTGTAAPIFMHRARVRGDVAVGVATTVYLPRTDNKRIDAPTSMKAAKSAKETQQDRKYLLRQAPVSLIMASGQPALGRQGSDMLEESTASGHSASEYLNFENWGVDDKYVESLCLHTKFSHIKHINMSENRITEKSIQAMHQTTVPADPWALQSLQLCNNRLREPGGLAISELCEMRRLPLRQLDLEGNMIGDVACEQLCKTLADVCHTLVGLGLAGNGLGRSAGVGQAIAGLLGTARGLTTLDLHWNAFHGAAAIAVLRGVYENGCAMQGNLRRLDLSWNSLGTRCGRDRAKQCKCCVCETCTEIARQLAQIFRDGTMLFHLDLSHNAIQARDCETLAEGLKENQSLFGIHMVGNEATVDPLGYIIPFYPDAAHEHQARQHRAHEFAGNIPTNLRLESMVGKRGAGQLNHTALASRSTDAFRKSVVAGITVQSPNVETNARASGGFPVGLVGSARANPSSKRLKPIPSMEGAGATATAFSDEALRHEKEWAEMRARVRQPWELAAEYRELSGHSGAPCCWICDNWVEIQVSYVPGWSGPESSADDVAEVYAFFSVDDFSRPLRLARKEETYQRRLLQLERKGKLAVGGARPTDLDYQRGSSEPCLLPSGRLVRWVGVRRLPPSRVPVQVVFQVNGVLRVAEDMACELLPEPKRLQLAGEAGAAASQAEGVDSAVDTGVGATAASPVGEENSVEEEEADDDAEETDDNGTVAVANVLFVWTSAEERIKSREAQYVLALEDPKRRAQAAAKPRTVEEAPPPPPKEWCFEDSIWFGYARTPPDCFEHDWKLTRLEKLVKDKGQHPLLCKLLGEAYPDMLLAFYYAAFRSCSSGRTAIGLNLEAFIELLGRYGGGLPESNLAMSTVSSLAVSSRRPSKGFEDDAEITTGADVSGSGVVNRPSEGTDAEVDTAADGDSSDSGLFNRKFKLADAEIIHLSCSVFKHRTQLSRNRSLPHKGLHRFQFLEAIVRIALRRFGPDLVGPEGEPATAGSTVEELLKLMKFGHDVYEVKDRFHKDLFCEECELVFKAYHTLLEDAFVMYRKAGSYPGKPSWGVTFDGWLQLVQDLALEGIGDGSEAGTSFALAHEIRVDEETPMRSAELRWQEFLVALGALVWLLTRSHANPQHDSFADQLCDFLRDRVSKACNERRRAVARRDPGTAGTSRGKPTNEDPAVAGTVALTEKVFKEVDADNAGEVSVREFRYAWNEPQNQQELVNVGAKAEDMELLLEQMDVDENSVVTLEDLCTAYVNLKFSMSGVDRAVSFLRKAFAEADVDNSGLLAPSEISSMLEEKRVEKRLATLGVPREQVEALVEQLQTRGVEISPNKLVAMMLNVHDTGIEQSRGINYLWQAFNQADKDRDGQLTREEIKVWLCENQNLRDKLKSLRLEVPDWLQVFDALDIDGSGELSWDELFQGVANLWDKRGRSMMAPSI